MNTVSGAGAERSVTKFGSKEIRYSHKIILGLFSKLDKKKSSNMGPEPIKSRNLKTELSRSELDSISTIEVLYRTQSLYNPGRWPR